MLARPLLPLALGAIAINVATPAAAAGPCCPCAAFCVPPPVVVLQEPVVVRQKPRYVKPYYVVDQGPVYGGPGIVAFPTIENFHAPPADYPYVTRVYYYPPYDAGPRWRWRRAYK